jgi:hypothetical protein
MSEAADVRQLIHALALDGAHQFDPVGFHYIETLAGRASAHQGSVQRILEGKLGVAAYAFKARLEQAQGEPKRTPATLVPAEAPETLRGLVCRLAQDRSGQVAGQANVAIGQRPELKSIKNFRNTWSKLSVNKQVTQALTQAPKNAGPLNSHRVALRSLALMRDISPDYLNRFMSYVDTLLCLDQGDTGLLPSRAIPVEGSSGKKVKAPRTKNKL